MGGSHLLTNIENHAVSKYWEAMFFLEVSMQYVKCSNPVIGPVRADGKLTDGGSCCQLVELSDREFAEMKASADALRKRGIEALSVSSEPASTFENTVDGVARERDFRRAGYSSGRS